MNADTENKAPERLWLITQDGSPLPSWYRFSKGDALYDIEQEYEYIRHDLVSSTAVPPVDMILFCPNCWEQHIDAEEDEIAFQHRMEAWALVAESQDNHPSRWTNPPHRSHLCHKCFAVWRPADVPTNGVAKISTQGRRDTWTPCQLLAAPAPSDAQDLISRQAAYDVLRLIHHRYVLTFRKEEIKGHCPVCYPRGHFTKEPPTLREDIAAIVTKHLHTTPSTEAQKCVECGHVEQECTWTYNPDGYWQTSCGDQFMISNEEGPSANGMNFCHHCGRRLVARTEPEGTK
jgi:hypothetical protein